MYVCIRIHLYIHICTSDMSTLTRGARINATQWQSKLEWQRIKEHIRNIRDQRHTLFSALLSFEIEVSKWPSANQGSVGRRKKPAPRRDDSRRRDRRWAFQKKHRGWKIEMSMLSIKNSRAPPVGFFCWGRDRGRGRQGWQSWSFFDILQKLAWREMEIGAQTGQTLVVEEAGSRRCTTFDSTRCCADIDIDVDLCSKNTLDTHKRWLPEKIIKNKPTFGVWGRSNLVWLFWCFFWHEDRYNIDEAAQRKLGMLPPEQADTLLRSLSTRLCLQRCHGTGVPVTARHHESWGNLETGNIRNPSAFIMKAVSCQKLKDLDFLDFGFIWNSDGFRRISLIHMDSWGSRNYRIDI